MCRGDISSIVSATKGLDERGTGDVDASRNGDPMVRRDDGRGSGFLEVSGDTGPAAGSTRRGMRDMSDLNDYEWQLAQRYRDDLFDLELGSDLSLLEAEHPLAGGINALLRPVASRRPKHPRKQPPRGHPQPAATQERLDL